VPIRDGKLFRLTSAILYFHTVVVAFETMLPPQIVLCEALLPSEFARLCSVDTKYSCPKCGSFGIETSVLPDLEAATSAREAVARLRSYGHLPVIQRRRTVPYMMPRRRYSWAGIEGQHHGK